LAALDIETQVAGGSLAGEFDMTSAHLPTLTVLIIEEPENSTILPIGRQAAEANRLHPGGTHRSGRLAFPAKQRSRIVRARIRGADG